MCTDRAACSVPWAVLTPVACIVQVNLSTLLTGLGDGSLLCPTTSALGATVARSDAYDSAMQELARVQTENVNLRAEVDCLVHVRAENVSLQAEVRRAREQLKRSTESVLVELDATSAASETMQARAEREQQLKLQQAQLQHERNMEAATAEATAQLCMHSDRTAAAQAHSSQLTAQLQARVAALEQECVVLRANLTDAVERRHSDVPTFDFLCADGQATQRADGTHLCGKRWNNLPGAAKVSDNYSCAYLEEDAPRWVDDRVREALRRQFRDFMQQACIITGWDQRVTHKFMGQGGKVGAVLARMLRYTHEDGTDTHGTFHIDHVLTALLSSMPAQRHLRDLATTNARLARVLRQVVGPIILNPPRLIAAAIHAAGVTRRQMEIIMHAAAGPAYCSPAALSAGAMDDLRPSPMESDDTNTRKRKRCCTQLLPSRRLAQSEAQLAQEAVIELFGILSTGSNGAHVDPMRAVPAGVELMPGYVNVLNRLSHSAAMFRRACLCVARLLCRRFDLHQPSDVPLEVDTDQDPGPSGAPPCVRTRPRRCAGRHRLHTGRLVPTILVLQHCPR